MSFSQFVMLLDRVREALAKHFPELPRFELTGMMPVLFFRSERARPAAA